MPGARPAALAFTVMVAGVELAEGSAYTQSVPSVLTLNDVGCELVSNTVCASSTAPEKLSCPGKTDKVTTDLIVIDTAMDRGLLTAPGELIESVAE